MDRLVDTVDTALAIGDTAQTGTGQETQGTGDNTSLITDDITEQVASNDDTVQLAGVLDHKHSSGVNQVVTNLELGELLSHNLSDDLAPETAGSQDVGLVQTPHGERGVVLQSQVSGQTDDTLDLGAGVGLGVHGEAGTVVLLAVAEVDTTRQLTDDVEVDAAADIGLEGGALDQRGSGEVAGTQVAECAHLLAQTEDTLLGTDGAGAPFLLMKKLTISIWFPHVLHVRIRMKGIERTGPPMAPRRTASAFLAASRASSVRGEPVASMEA